MLALTIASTTIVPQHQRGKLSGLFMTSESLGRVFGPVTFSSVYAWSISLSAPGWIDYRLVFVAAAVCMVVLLALGWRTFSVETMSPPSLPPLPLAERTQGSTNGEPAAVAGEHAAPSAHGPAKEAMASPGAHRGHGADR